MSPPIVERPTFPGVFVVRSACELRGDVLYFEDKPVGGAVANVDESDEYPEHEFRRASIESYRNGRSDGPWEDPIAGIDLSICYRTDEHGLEPEPADATAFISAKDGLVVQVTDAQPQARFYRFRDRRIGSLCLFGRTSSAGTRAKGSWSWLPDGRLSHVGAWISVENGTFDPADRTKQRNSAQSMRFDQDGDLSELSVSGPHWRHLDELAVAFDMWIPRGPAELFGLKPAETLRVRSLDGFEAEVIEAAPIWLEPVRHFECDNRFDLEFLSRLFRIADPDSIRLNELQTDELAAFAIDLLQGRPGRVVKSSHTPWVTVTTAKEVAASPDWRVGMVVFDNEVEHLLAAHVFRLTTPLTQLAIASTKLEYLEVDSAFIGSDQLETIIAANPQATISAAGRHWGQPPNAKASRKSIGDWLANHRTPNQR